MDDPTHEIHVSHPQPDRLRRSQTDERTQRDRGARCGATVSAITHTCVVVATQGRCCPARGEVRREHGLRGVAVTGTTWPNLDSFTAARYAAEGEGVTIGAFVAHPLDALELALLKESATAGVRRNLLQADPTQAGRRTIDGTPLETSSAVARKTIWAIPVERVTTVIRSDVTIEADSSVYFTSDRVAVKATIRVGFAFPHPKSVVRMALAVS